MDVNILVYAHREDFEEHRRYRNWLHRKLTSAEPLGVAPLVLSGFLRTVTHPRIFATPTPLPDALQFAEQVSRSPNAVEVRAGPRHRDLFFRLCRQAGATGNAIPDAYLAALAIESGCEWITEDRGFARFEGLRWRPPDLD